MNESDNVGLKVIPFLGVNASYSQHKDKLSPLLIIRYFWCCQCVGLLKVQSMPTIGNEVKHYYHMGNN